ncbi:AraC family transcriptional regulator [Paenibacillus sacheonensis]|uniref:AraC family transcriptional regulator n=1 Tax=Paenibacillus sacheonensis TaxID=742054 RepID=A0A7X4YSV8_9BACL|nr:AraC family transcriptional regulator [Paenibacillus sacheonensis]MBM7567784.1 AraC family transcriptional regulator of arabinose operon [Paenibacillus sacheonensis]NBC71947.1 AraC family transcriptional regulator [Paenibacillus sacheonensis]
MIEVLHAKYSIHDKAERSKISEEFPYYFIRLQVEGACRADIGGRSETVRAGDLILCEPGMPCETVVDAGAEGQSPFGCLSADYYVFCRGPWLDEWWAKQTRAPIANIALEQGLLTLWKLLISEKIAEREPGQDMAPYLLQALCTYLDRMLNQVMKPTRSSSNFDAAYLIKHFIDKNVTTPFKLQDIADHVGLSVTRIVHLFKKTYNLTITEYANQTRLSYACTQIEFSNLSLESIAESVGFHNYSYFHRLFRARYGMSPRQFRNQ